MERVLCDERREGGWNEDITQEEIEAACVKISTLPDELPEKLTSV